MSGSSARKPAIFQTSHLLAKIGATEIVSTPLARSSASATARDNSFMPAVSRAQTSSPSAVFRKPLAARSKTGRPSASSVRNTCWLTAPTVTPSSSAAAASVPSRPTASTARNPDRCTRFRLFI